MSAPTRPILRYHGGKWRLAPWIITHLPPHRVYVEPFGGGASVLMRKPRAITEIFNDLDDDVVNVFRVLRETPEALAAALALTPFSRAEYGTLYEEDADPVERARRFVARSFFAFSSKGALARSGFDMRINPDAFVGRLRSFTALPEVVCEVAGRLSHVIIECTPASTLIRRLDRPDTLFYVDPPYLPDTRTGGLKYRHELTRDEHAELLEVLDGLAGMVVLSGYPNPLYEDRLGHWRRVQTLAHTDHAHRRTEVLWINPAAAAALDARGMPLFGPGGGAVREAAE